MAPRTTTASPRFRRRSCRSRSLWMSKKGLGLLERFHNATTGSLLRENFDMDWENAQKTRIYKLPVCSLGRFKPDHPKANRCQWESSQKDWVVKQDGTWIGFGDVPTFRPRDSPSKHSNEDSPHRLQISLTDLGGHFVVMWLQVAYVEAGNMSMREAAHFPAKQRSRRHSWSPFSLRQVYIGIGMIPRVCYILLNTILSHIIPYYHIIPSFTFSVSYDLIPIVSQDCHPARQGDERAEAAEAEPRELRPGKSCYHYSEVVSRLASGGSVWNYRKIIGKP